MRLSGWRLALVALPAACATPAHADEPLFGYIYTTDILPKGQKEVEQWSTLREGRSNGYFHVWQGRTELSYGLTNNFQLSAYFNYAYANVYHDGPDGTTTPPEVFAEYSAGPDEHFEHWRSEGLSLEGIYRFFSPYTTNGWGLALYVEPTVAPHTREVETRLILQRNFYDDRIVLSGNLTLAYEWRRLPGDPDADPTSPDFNTHWDKETDLNLGLGASYRFAPNWSIGAELLNERELAGLNPFDSSNRTNVAYYVGPNIHYGGKHFFATVTALAQLPWASDLTHEQPSAVIHGISNGDDFEKYRLRVKVGYFF
jgi:hypothetical protein